ncbi:hypothetical protein FHX42_002651 [Saccharopolyspora lacisalsi]|uniref:HTH psq-type domain-containing protein n=1 Tax=Halosaccharopolyspora lacisalsi TaxID=1000566 RepID=A0A839DWP5_9PSEU|nr:hypothetical protein [Halosaccharopolyspora lacisalsi]MBA8825300.1 hypothetical protein [Halosaccharopolyspora lacisalsi]
MARTDAQRTRDYRARQRRRNPPMRRPGENIDRAGRSWRILTDQQVRGIRARLTDDDAPSRVAVAREYGVHPSTISQIAAGRRRATA